MAGSMWIVARNKAEASKKARDRIDTKKYKIGAINHYRSFKNGNKEYAVYTRKKKSAKKPKKTKWDPEPGATGWRQTDSRVWWHNSNTKWISIIKSYNAGAYPKIKYGAFLGYNIYLYHVDPNWKRRYSRPVESRTVTLVKKTYKTLDPAQKFVKNYIKKHP